MTRPTPIIGSHTPGPWDAPKATVINKKAWSKLHSDEPMQFVTVGFDGFSGETVAIVYGDDEAQELSNARLIAECPTMLAVLKAVVAAFPPTLHRNGAQVMALMEARDLVERLEA